MNIRRSPRWRCKTAKTSRYLLFDEQLQLCGRRSGRDGEPELVRPSPQTAGAGVFRHPRDFSAPLSLMTEEGVFSIITSYLRLAGQGEKILAFRADEYYWRDLGKPEDVEQAAQDLEAKTIVQ